MKIVFILLAGTLFLLAPTTSFAQTAAPQGTAPQATSTETATLTVPPSWKASPASMVLSGFTMTNLWYAPAPLFKGDNLGLGYVENPSGASLDAIVGAMNSAYQKMVGTQNAVASHAEKVCDGTAAGWFFQNNITIGTMNMISEQTIALGKTRMFAATYTRVNSESEDAAARKALDSLCVKS